MSQGDEDAFPFLQGQSYGRSGVSPISPIGSPRNSSGGTSEQQPRGTNPRCFINPLTANSHPQPGLPSGGNTAAAVAAAAAAACGTEEEGGASGGGGGWEGGEVVVTIGGDVPPSATTTTGYAQVHS